MKKSKMIFLVCLILTVITSTTHAKDIRKLKSKPGYSGKVLLDWNETTYLTMGGPLYQHSLMASRMYALVHVSMHDAVNAVSPKFATYAYHKKEPKANVQVAAASAAYHVLRTCFPERLPFLDSALALSISGITTGEAKALGLKVGAEAAGALLALGHNANGNLDFIAQPAPAVKPGDYKVVEPFNFIFAPFWENSKLFSLSRKDQFRCVPPPAISSTEYAEAFKEVKEVGALQSKTRTPEQTSYAKYWYEDSQTGWNRIARNVAASERTGLFEAARIFALLNMAIADAYTAGWDSKLYYNLWRPLTAIREAANDGNEATAADTAWSPCEITPPIQDYPSTHSALGNAGATVLAYFYGDRTSFSMTSPSGIAPDTVRSFKSFSDAANENADSRVKAGVHFRFACTAGQILGNQIGEWTTANYLKPLKHTSKI